MRRVPPGGRDVTALFVVHTAGAPGPDHVQRCVVCGLVLIDNAGWVTGDVAVLDGDDRGPSWWPVAALVGSSKRPGDRGGVAYLRAADRPLLDDNERPCLVA